MVALNSVFVLFFFLFQEYVDLSRSEFLSSDTHTHLCTFGWTHNDRLPAGKVTLSRYGETRCICRVLERRGVGVARQGPAQLRGGVERGVDWADADAR